MIRGLAKKYNKCYEEALPKVMTSHTLRHTFCTNLANAGMNPKALQYIMGHSNITMTLNYYAHATFVSAKADCRIGADGIYYFFTTAQRENLKVHAGICDFSPYLNCRKSPEIQAIPTYKNF